MIRVITYLAFTLLSIVIQFSLMELIQDTLNIEYKKVDLNNTSHKKELTHLVKDMTNKPHALYYRVNEMQKFLNLADDLASNVYANTTLGNAFETTTSVVSTVFEVFDLDNSTTESSFTTDIYTTTELGDVIESGIFSKKNRSKTEPKNIPKKETEKRLCNCNLLLNTCDANCCCDTDCSPEEMAMFIGCSHTGKMERTNTDACYPHISFGGLRNADLDSLFCLAKTNLPQKKPVPVQVLITLEFLATGSYQRVTGAASNVSQPATSRCIREIIDLLNTTIMLDRWIRFPATPDELARVRRGFHDKFQFPGIIGVVDASFMAMVRPSVHEELYFNRKGYHSLNVMIYTPATINKFVSKTLKWENKAHTRTTQKFAKKNYSYDDPIWILKNNKIYYLDMPSPMVNNFCTGRKRLKFLKEESVQCSVRLRDLEMIQVVENLDTTVISATALTHNSSALNCSTLHCVNWTILHCDDENVCLTYNKTLHEPSCNETVCTNIAQRITYEFYYHDNKIINTTVRLHTNNVSNGIPYLTQTLDVRFYYSNTSIDKIVKLSGNPGYNIGLPILTSFAKSNFSSGFFKSSNRYILLPSNKNGECFWSDDTKNIVLFGLNKRFKCRFHSAGNITFSNDTSAICNFIQKEVFYMLKIENDLVISPHGNPGNLKDEEWIKVDKEIIEKVQIAGEFNEENYKIRCYNLVTKFSFVYVFADVNDDDTGIVNKILSVKFDVGMQDVQIDVDDINVVISIDSTFIDITRPHVYEYAGSPHLNIHLPKDFFFPFPSKGFVARFHYPMHVVVFLFCTVLK